MQKNKFSEKSNPQKKTTKFTEKNIFVKKKIKRIKNFSEKIICKKKIAKNLQKTKFL